MSIEAGFVFKAGPITIEQLLEAMANLPEGTVVERISRDDREDVIAIGIASATTESEPVVEIRLRLPKVVKSRMY